jgi:hypothetical protein
MAFALGDLGINYFMPRIALVDCSREEGVKFWFQRKFQADRIPAGGFRCFSESHNLSFHLDSCHLFRINGERECV